MTRKVDTSQLGRIGIAPNDDKIRADMVREAMGRVARELWDRDASNKAAVVVQSLLDTVAYSKDETLSQLYRMLNP